MYFLDRVRLNTLMSFTVLTATVIRETEQENDVSFLRDQERVREIFARMISTD